MQLGELEGFARTVPPIIDGHWQSLWDEVMSQPGDPDEDPLDAFGRAAGEGTGGGFANFGRTVLVAAVVLGFETFKDFLALHLARRLDPSRRFGRTSIRDELEKELTELTFPDLIARYKSIGIKPRRIKNWADVEEIQFTRNALVHNHGRYTSQYFNAIKKPRYPTKEDMHGMDYTGLMTEDEKKIWLVDREDVPLRLDYVSQSLKTLASFAKRINDA